MDPVFTGGASPDRLPGFDCYYNQIIKSPEYQNNFSAYRDLAECYREAGTAEEGIRIWGIYSRKNAPEEKNKIEYELHLLNEAVSAGEAETIPIVTPVLRLPQTVFL